MLLTEPEIYQNLEDHPDRSYEDGQLVAHYEFGNFLEALSFVNDCGAVFEQINHHATIIINTDQVSLMVRTEDVEWITENDFALIAEVDKMVE